MGHRALVAYERNDGLYNVHYSHWGAANLRLKGRISTATPFGGDDADSEWAQDLLTALADGLDADAVGGYLADQRSPQTLVEPDPIALGCSREEILAEYLDYLNHEAFYEVSREFEVVAYRTLWFGLQYDCESITEGKTVGNGALTTVRWYDGESVGDGYLRGQFQALKAVVGDMIDMGVFSEKIARRHILEKLAEWIGERQDMLIPSVDSELSSSR